MTYFEKLTVLISSIGCLISIATLIYTFFANKKNKKTIIKLNSANLEVMLSERISSAREKTDQAMLKIAEVSGKNITKDHLTALQKSFNSNLENYLNILEEACAKYIDDKIDRVRFKQTYKTSIKQIFENQTYKNFLDSETAPKFPNLLKLYKDWHK
jgi:hypothetical protein